MAVPELLTLGVLASCHASKIPASAKPVLKSSDITLFIVVGDHHLSRIAILAVILRFSILGQCHLACHTFALVWTLVLA